MRRKNKYDISQIMAELDYKRRFVGPYAGASLYGMSYTKFRQLAREADANLVIYRKPIVDLRKIDEYLEKFKGDTQHE